MSTQVYELLARFLSRHPVRPPAGMDPSRYRDFIEKRRHAMVSLIEALANQAEGLLVPVRNGGNWGISKEARPDGLEWRITRFNGAMEPQGHEAHRSAEAALEDAILWADLARLQQLAVTSTKAFRQWFGPSLVVDDVGQPKVMYHGSLRDVAWFDRLKSTEWRRPSMDTVGSWFSDHPSEDGGAGMYANGEGAAIYPVYLAITRPKVYAKFTDFLREMHEAEGRKLEEQSPRGVGSTEGLRARLKAQGYDGIAFTRTNNQALHDSIAEAADSVRRARQDEFRVRRAERAPYTMKRERLEQTLASLQAELQAADGSTEFDKQRVWIAFEPWQVKSAIGNSGRFEPDSPSLTDREDDQDAAAMMQPRERMRA